MTFRTWWKKLALWKKISLITIIALISAVIIVGIVILFYPIAGKIVEDEPFLTFVCKVQPFSYVEDCGTIICNKQEHFHQEYLKAWKGYHGCNESTKGYDGQGNIKGILCCHTIVLT